eukprot:CAMPEP_0119562416 /NCGR_PEP_ID=MMETSP1352-20130426/20385_1 /TAXON_ID=265584 /ORGANISM="Stauroneis constricta, Strain CCMP1120" /LENGTH=268 /DNA_ID=CAMNT_0007610811 /DNA_START=72 /DNA_END=878 /DNA_ORIENTATION=+
MSLPQEQQHRHQASCLGEDLDTTAHMPAVFEFEFDDASYETIEDDDADCYEEITLETSSYVTIEEIDGLSIIYEAENENEDFDYDDIDDDEISASDSTGSSSYRTPIKEYGAMSPSSVMSSLAPPPPPPIDDDATPKIGNSQRKKLMAVAATGPIEGHHCTISSRKTLTNEDAASESVNSSSGKTQPQQQQTHLHFSLPLLDIATIGSHENTGPLFRLDYGRGQQPSPFGETQNRQEDDKDSLAYMFNKLQAQRRRSSLPNRTVPVAC